MLFVLAIVMFLTIGIAALLVNTRSTGLVAMNLEEFSAYNQRIDGQMERMTNLLRDDATLDCPSTEVPAVDGTLAVDCYDRVVINDPVTVTPIARKYNLQVTDDGEVVGQARILINDTSNGATSVGDSLLVCDWMIGRDLVLDDTLIGCPDD